MFGCLGLYAGACVFVCLCSALRGCFVFEFVCCAGCLGLSRFVCLLCGVSCLCSCVCLSAG